MNLELQESMKAAMAKFLDPENNRAFANVIYVDCDGANKTTMASHGKALLAMTEQCGGCAKGKYSIGADGKMTKIGEIYIRHGLAEAVRTTAAEELAEPIGTEGPFFEIMRFENGTVINRIYWLAVMEARDLLSPGATVQWFVSHRDCIDVPIGFRIGHETASIIGVVMPIKQ